MSRLAKNIIAITTGLPLGFWIGMHINDLIGWLQFAYACRNGCAATLG